MKVHQEDPDGRTTAVGTWRASAMGTEVKSNGIRYVLAGKEQPLLPLIYAFNEKNQLTATIPAQANEGGASASFVFEGSIAIDDHDDVVYFLANPDGVKPRPRITVYGELSLSEDATALQIALAENGGSTRIAADTDVPGISWLESIRNPNTSSQPGMDMLVFRATTINEKAGNFPANIAFTGLWDIKEGQVTFMSKIKADPQGVKAALALQGHVKGVSYGLQVTTDGAGPTIGLLVRGVHKWRAGDASWQIALGYSEKKFVTNANVNVEMTPGIGQSLRITGSVQLAGELGKGNLPVPLQQSLGLDLDLSVVYVVNKPNKTILFRANFVGNTLNLELSGKYVFRNGVVEFSLLHQDGTPVASLSLRFQTDGLSVALRVITDGTKIDCQFSFEIKLIWVNGQLVRRDPMQLAA
jgi:hypothetical protein